MEYHSNVSNRVTITDYLIYLQLYSQSQAHNKLIPHIHSLRSGVLAVIYKHPDKIIWSNSSKVFQDLMTLKTFFLLCLYYSITRQRGKCSLRYSNNSRETPGQLVSSNSCRWRSWIRLDRPLDVRRGQPARDKTWRFLIPHRCCSPKSRTWEHQRRNRADNDNMVDI